MIKIFDTKDYKKQNNVKTLITPVTVEKNDNSYIIHIEEYDNNEIIVSAENQKNGDVMYISLGDLTYNMRNAIVSEMAMLLFSETAEGKKGRTVKTYAKQ